MDWEVLKAQRRPCVHRQVPDILSKTSVSTASSWGYEVSVNVLRSRKRLSKNGLNYSKIIISSTVTSPKFYNVNCPVITVFEDQNEIVVIIYSEIDNYHPDVTKLRATTTVPSNLAWDKKKTEWKMDKGLQAAISGPHCQITESNFVKLSCLNIWAWTKFKVDGFNIRALASVNQLLRKNDLTFPHFYRLWDFYPRIAWICLRLSLKKLQLFT